MIVRCEVLTLPAAADAWLVGYIFKSAKEDEVILVHNWTPDNCISSLGRMMLVGRDSFVEEMLRGMDVSVLDLGEKKSLLQPPSGTLQVALLT